MGNALSNLLSISTAVGFVLGFLASRLWCVYKYWRVEHKHAPPHHYWREGFRVDARPLAGLIGLVFVGWSVFTTQANSNEQQRLANEATAFAAKVQECQQQLIGAINGSRAITTDNDEIDSRIRGAQQRWLAALVAPPPPLDKMPTNAPERQAYGLTVTINYQKEVDNLEAERRANAASRPELPPPDCGNK